jgi:hypothetical protein
MIHILLPGGPILFHIGRKLGTTSAAHVVTKGLQNVRLAHWTGPMFQQPGINTAFVENVPETKS